MRQDKRRLRGPIAVSALVLLAAVVATGSRLSAGPSAADEATVAEAARRYFPGEAESVPARRIFRLTRDQLDLTAKSLFPGYKFRSVKDFMPKDPLQTNYEYAELLSFNAANTGPLSGWIEEIAAAVRKAPTGLINCPAGAGAKECQEQAARAFVVRAFRGDVSDGRIDRIVRFYLEGIERSGFGEATGDLVEVALRSPDFLFRKEIDIDRYRRLTPAQLLQSLSYTIADAPPEKLGLESHNAGQHLYRGDSAAGTIERIVTSPEARAKLLRFFMTWLEVKDPGEFTISQQLFPEFDAALAGAMVEETRRFLAAVLGKPQPVLRDITQSTQSYVSSALAPIYAVKPGDAAGTRLVSLDPSQRLGIFSQPAVLASHSGPTGTRPIKRGVFWVRKVMCMDLEPPPNGIDSTIPEAKHTTERQRIEAVTGQKACVGCHKVIDPFGFFQESYDTLGRWRTTDNGSPVDPSITVSFLDEGPLKTATPVEALRAFTDSIMFKQCFVRQLFRFYMGRSEEPADEPLLRRMFLNLARNDSILDVVKGLAVSDRIARRL